MSARDRDRDEADKTIAWIKMGPSFGDIRDRVWRLLTDARNDERTSLLAENAKLREVAEEVAMMPLQNELPRSADWHSLTIKAKSALGSPPQRQDSLDDQLRDLQVIANRLGMYDAADFITQRAKKDPDLDTAIDLIEELLSSDADMPSAGDTNARAEALLKKHGRE